jgi:uncharacterized protein (TIRG00374 family)
MHTARSRRRIRWQTLLIAALTLALLGLFFGRVDLAAVGRAIVAADVRLIALAVVANFVTYVLRAWRWQVLLAPIGAVRFRTAFRTTVIGFAVTFLLPARVGEVLRPYLLARQEGFNATAAFATVIVERLLDVATVLLLFALAMPFSGVVVADEVQAAGMTAGIAAGVALTVLFVCAGHPERLGRWAEKAGGWLPGKLAALLTHAVRTFAEGLAVLRSPGHLLAAVAWSAPLWCSIALSIWITSRAFGLVFPFVGTLLVMGPLAVGVALPTPGGAGGFHYAYLYAVTLFFGSNADVAAAAAIVLHAVSFVPVTLVGLLFMWQDGLSVGRLRGLRATAQAETT